MARVGAWRNLFPSHWSIPRDDSPSDFVLNLEEKALMKILVKERMTLVHLLKEVLVECGSSPARDLGKNCYLLFSFYIFYILLILISFVLGGEDG